MGWESCAWVRSNGSSCIVQVAGGWAGAWAGGMCCRGKGFQGQAKGVTWPVTWVSVKSSLHLEMCVLPLCHPLPLGCTIKIETDSANHVHEE